MATVEGNKMLEPAPILLSLSNQQILKDAAYYPELNAIELVWAFIKRAYKATDSRLRVAGPCDGKRRLDIFAEAILTWQRELLFRKRRLRLCTLLRRGSRRA